MEGAATDDSLLAFIVSLRGVAGTPFTPLSLFNRDGRVNQFAGGGGGGLPADNIEANAGTSLAINQPAIPFD
ncbi:hypothetical protein, partial [Rhodopirellula bahusiensis]|uniref:hypothetical protein n=1 Tax=Rhodopirellula bahusiensis TaxID=2014065 RepID=UPI003298BA7A